MRAPGSTVTALAPPGPLAPAIEEHILSVPLDPWGKGIGNAPPGTTLAGIAALGWSLGGTGLLPPVALLKSSALEHNLALMAEYCRTHQVLLAPHGKTTMAPQIIDRQLALGAWAITTGSIAQTRTLAGFGVRRLLLAHQVYDDAGLRELGRLVSGGVEVITLIDSVAGVAMMDEGLRRLPGSPQVPVLVELGIPGGRTGCRSVDELESVARAVGQSSSLRLLGVEGYEGVLGGDPDSGTLVSVDAFLDRLAESLDRLRAGSTGDFIISAGGSAFFDRVVARFGGGAGGARVVLRSGCYAVHDHGKYQRASPLDGRATGGETLRPALEVWASVVSCPEPGMVVLNAGRRDVSFDAGLPVIVATLRRGESVPTGLAEAVPVRRIMDQHAVAEAPAGGGVRPGDLVGLGVSHPCTTFDKWKLIPVVDDGYGVITGVATFF